MKEQKETINQEESAEFNSALAYLKRVNELEYGVENSLMNKEWKSMFEYLESYENELCYAFNDEENQKIAKMKEGIDEIFQSCPKIGELVKNPHYPHILYTIGTQRIPTLKKKLIELDKYLRSLKQKYGLGMPSKGAGKLF